MVEEGIFLFSELPHVVSCFAAEVQQQGLFLAGSLPFFGGKGDIDIKDGVVYYLVDGEPIATQPLREFRSGNRRANRKLAEYDATNAVPQHLFDACNGCEGRRPIRKP